MFKQVSAIGLCNSHIRKLDCLPQTCSVPLHCLFAMFPFTASLVRCDVVSTVSYICMCVRMYVCMCVHMYVCMCVHTYVPLATGLVVLYHAFLQAPCSRRQCELLQSLCTYVLMSPLVHVTNISQSCVILFTCHFGHLSFHTHDHFKHFLLHLSPR